MTTLAEKALLVQLNISQWTARKRDRKVTQEVASGHGVAASAGNYNKALLPGEASLKNVHNKSVALRNYFYTNTLAWDSNGTQLLPARHFLEFGDGFRELREAWDKAVYTFVLEYPRLVAEAPIKLRGMFEASDYPDASRIAERFSVKLHRFNVPSTDFRVAISDTEREELVSEAEERLSQAHAAANKEVVSRLAERVSFMAEKLKDHKAIITNSLVDNTREMCKLLKSLDISGDQTVLDMIDTVEFELTSIHPDVLRHDPSIRNSRAAEAEKILNKIRGVA